MKKIILERPKDYQAQTGEILEMHFSIISFPILKQIQINAIKDKFNKDSHIEVLNSELIGNDLSFKIKIINNPFPLVLAIVSVTTILAGFFVMTSLDKVYKIVEEPGSQILSWGALAGSVAAIIGLFVIFRKGVK